ncbi:hypothetical protein [Clostridium amazonitimonense]|uniref:hypothetical protein n=1 Tax=Clostridium amazonitimonense TaxID=1499689 RepID=UPI0005099A80|nr:hypothetical protein [Clostridium amazonitimonense]
MKDKGFEKIFQIMNLMAFLEILIWKVHYDTYINEDGTYVLRINYNKCYDKILDYCKVHHINYPNLDIKAFKFTLKSKPYCLCYNAPAWFKKETSSKESQVVRAAFIDIKALQAMGIFIDNLLCNNTLMEIKEG